MRNLCSRALLVAGLLTLAACGGGGDGSAFENPPSNGGGGGTPPANNVASVTVTSNVPSIASTGSDAAEITAMVRDASNVLIAGVPVTFTATSGGIAVTQATTDSSGQAKATLVTAGDSSLRTITVTAAVGAGLSGTVNVQVVAGGGSGGAASVQMGSGTGAGFQPGVIGVQSANVSAGGSTSLSVVLQRTDGSLFAQPATITFSSPCIAQSLATVNGGQPVQTSTGIVNTSYAATGCSGEDTIIATATVGGQALSASGTVNVAAAAIGSIVFESASPTNIALRGTGSAGNPESSTVVFRVLDSTGGPRSGADVTFSLNTTVGGLSLGPISGQSGADGRVQTVVQGGTVATTVRVTATVTNISPSISTQSSQLTVTTGIPDQDSFSLAVQCQNVEAWRKDGVVVPVTARLADRFNNPVPDGTAVTFTAEGGVIQSSCITTGGQCTVNWTSSNPRPAAFNGNNPGRASLLATAIGEESFNDLNGNGIFDAGDTFVDLGEAFVDWDENGAYTPGEPIYDFNSNGTRDGPDGFFNGVLCQDPARCNAQSTTGISDDNVIIMSDNVPVPTPAAGTVLAAVTGAPATPGSRTYFITFADLNNNPLPAQSTISAQVQGTGFSLAQPTSFTVPCTTQPTTYPFTVQVTGSADPTGTLLITVTSGGVSFPITYTVPR
jgi:hypothetical protein